MACLCFVLWVLGCRWVWNTCMEGPRRFACCMSVCSIPIYTPHPRGNAPQRHEGKPILKCSKFLPWHLICVEPLKSELCNVIPLGVHARTTSGLKRSGLIPKSSIDVSFLPENVHVFMTYFTHTPSRNGGPSQ